MYLSRETSAIDIIFMRMMIHEIVRHKVRHSVKFIKSSWANSSIYQILPNSAKYVTKTSNDTPNIKILWDCLSREIQSEEPNRQKESNDENTLKSPRGGGRARAKGAEKVGKHRDSMKTLSWGHGDIKSPLEAGETYELWRYERGAERERRRREENSPSWPDIRDCFTLF